MKKTIIFSLILLSSLLGQSVFAQPANDAAAKPVAPAPAAPGAKPAKAEPAKPEIPLPFWKIAPLPTVGGKIERRYDINRDKILQPAETTIFLRDVIDAVTDKTFYAVDDSALLKKYDKNKDGIINKFEADDIKKDVQEQ